MARDEAGPLRQGQRARRRSGSETGRFNAERRALGKIQVHFEFQQSLMRRIRLAAAEGDLSYTDYVRKLVDLPYTKIQRPRISLSFSAEDLRHLAKRYGEPVAQTARIKRRVMQEVMEEVGTGQDASDAEGEDR